MAERRTVRRSRQDNDERDADRPVRASSGERTRERAGNGEGSGGRRRAPRRRRDGGLTAAEAAQEGLRQIAELTGRQPEGVTGVEPHQDGWVVGVEIVVDRRIPSSTDILATYEAEFDADGELLAYRRVRRYARGRGDSEDRET